MPTVENVSDPLGYAMVMMTVGIIPMKETVQVKFQYWPGCQNPKTEILYHQKPLYAGLGIYTGLLIFLVYIMFQFAFRELNPQDLHHLHQPRR